MVRLFLHILLSVLLLATTAGVTIKKHYCLGELKYATLNIWAQPCCGDKSEMRSGCCRDEYSFSQLDDDFQANAFVSLVYPELQLSFPPLFDDKLPGEDLLSTYPPYCNYKPPLIYEDVLLLIQTFLI
jgi:hypothetical protein